MKRNVKLMLMALEIGTTVLWGVLMLMLIMIQQRTRTH